MRSTVIVFEMWPRVITPCSVRISDVGEQALLIRRGRVLVREVGGNAEEVK